MIQASLGSLYYDRVLINMDTFTYPERGFFDIHDHPPFYSRDLLLPGNTSWMIFFDSVITILGLDGFEGIL